ncbi:MotA/TolQ/ExbB proton channel family protein [Desulfobulbus rhabdoformis]|uniref:MotA/TolQ/ExbB proton channel family protein n=1 Tax=Desulfobulbus rhabdoformis TaxID=34032 RepID=UPI0019635D4B|nr:MotA/TolQ/ExbB proton channel family protein [Desulfobulbus rhabdoformis]MBM9614826.1 MotA/TolQ/ExbB proton channel family protein [Desulfobulbus rhabdoformis]
MRKLILLLLPFWAAACLTASLEAADMRELPHKAQQVKDELARKALAEKAEAAREAAATRAKVFADRRALENAVAQLEAEKKQLSSQVETLEKSSTELAEEETAVNEELAQTDGMIKELVGQIRINAKDLDTLISQNPQSGVGPAPSSFLAAVADDERFPGMDDVRAMAEALLTQIKGSGEVRLEKGTIIDRTGREVEADILFIGPFTAAYHLPEETGFLNHSSDGSKLYALSRLPAKGLQKQLAQYMSGQADSVPVDIGRGAALRQLSHRLSFSDQVTKGGPIVWPILAILVIGLLIVAERTIKLLRNRHAKLPLIDTIRQQSREGDWAGCEQACSEAEGKPLGRVLLAGVQARDLQREDLENTLQEAILKEIPGLEHFLSTLGMLTAIAPLLGLLGTVTGMINVFHVITLYGASDPRLMSGGISEALVTTMLGLSVAIPLMLLHNMLTRGVDRMVGDLEEQAVSLVNIIHRRREQQC